jgi:hypothetical protein
MKFETTRSGLIFTLKAGVAIMTLASISNAAFAATKTPVPAPGIYGTYIVTDERTCIYSPSRSTPTPAYFEYSSSDSIGNIVVGNGVPASTASTSTYRLTQAASYQMVVNPINNSVSITDGTYNLVPDIVFGTTPPIAAQFGIFTGSGTYTSSVANSIDAELQTVSALTDGNTITSSSPGFPIRFRTLDGGVTFFTTPGRSAITLQFISGAALYRDRYCATTIVGRRVSTAY